MSEKARHVAGHSPNLEWRLLQKRVPVIHVVPRWVAENGVLPECSEWIKIMASG
jgi:hypothetical protein